MTMKLVKLSSVNARITLFAIAILVIGASIAAWFISLTLRNDVQHLLTAQQLAVSESFVKSIDRDVRERFLGLEHVGRMAGVEMTGDPARLQAILDGLPLFQRLFNGGTFITDIHGKALASVPASAQRVGLSYADRDYVQAVLATGQPAVGAPVQGRALGVPVIPIAAPVRGPDGTILGVIAGVINLGRPSFLDAIQRNPFGKTGTQLLVDHHNRVVITASSPDRAMEALPAPGAYPYVDRFVEGFEGSQILVNPRDEEVLVTVKHSEAAHWYVAVTLPTREAFAPVVETERRMMAGLVVVSLVVGVLLWWMNRRQLMPLRTTADALAEASQHLDPDTPIAPLPVHRPDEIGRLIEAFNQLIGELARQRADLARSELLYSTAFQTSPDSISITRVSDGQVLTVNERFTRMLGWRLEDIVGRSTVDMGMWHNPDQRHTLVELLQRDGRVESHQADLVTSDGRIVSVEMSAALVDFAGEACMLGITHDITERQVAQRQIERLALTDALTGLPNRRLLIDRLAQAVPESIREGRHGALLFINMDRLKSLNDRLGHERVDTLLRDVGQLLHASTRPGDTVARVGGDEFVVLLRNLDADPQAAQAEALRHAEHLLESIGQGKVFVAHDEPVSASLGVALFGQPDDRAGDLFNRADLAMHQAKDAGRNQVCLFDARAHASHNSRVRLEADLRTSLAAGQIQLHYQIQVDSQQRILGLEALARWPHPERGMVPPSEFIPLAEATGLIVPLGHWILETACRQLAQWARDPAMASLDVSVNVTSRQFEEPDFVAQLLATLERTGADPRRLKLELTESLLIDRTDVVTSTMRALKARGIGFSLDDFGTGFSSLAYLKRLPLDELKIDASFVRDIEFDSSDQAIAAMIVTLGNSLGLRVLAEGVERPSQRTLLQRIGCHSYQGYLFSRPVPAEAVESLVRRGLQPLPATASAPP